MSTTQNFKKNVGSQPLQNENKNKMKQNESSKKNKEIKITK